MKHLAEKFGLPIVENIMNYPLVINRASVIPYSLAKQKKLLPIEEIDGGWMIAVSNPTDLEGIEELRLLLKGTLQFIYAPLAAVDPAIEHCYRQMELRGNYLLGSKQKKIQPMKPSITTIY